MSSFEMPFNNVDERRFEVVVDGLPLFRGAQLAIDATLVRESCEAQVCHRKWCIVCSSLHTEREALRARLVVLGRKSF